MAYVDPETRELAAESVVSLRNKVRNTVRDTVRKSVYCTRITELCTWYIATSVTYSRKWLDRGKEILSSIYPAKREA
jgi:hypothetical protein